MIDKKKLNIKNKSIIGSMKLLVVFLGCIILASNMVSASIDCGTNPSFSVSYEKSEIPTSDIPTLSCNGNADQISISGSGTSHISMVDTAISGSKNIKIAISQDIPAGSYILSISFFDNSTFVSSFPVSVIINEGEVEQGDILIFPTSKVITIQQNRIKTQNILITVPANYPRTVTIQSVDFNPGTETIRFDDLNLGEVSPGQSVSIPIIFDGSDAQIGTYQTNLNIFAIDSQSLIDLPSISLQLQVTGGVTPIDETTFSAKPSCSLSSSDMNLNETHTMSCSGVVNNLDVYVPYNKYFEGLGRDITSNIFTYTFRPVKFGNTDFVAYFENRGSTIFTPFKQSVRVSSTGGVVPGTNLKLIFTPSLDVAKDSQSIAVQVVDNSSNSLVKFPSLDIDAIPIDNSSERTFFVKFKANKNYSIRASAIGYNDLVEIISLTSQPMDLQITPEEGNTLTTFTITTRIFCHFY